MNGNPKNSGGGPVDFIEGICSAVRTGYGIVPLIGAGASAPSGIPIVRELSIYLNRCILMALGLDPYRHIKWMPGDEWPEFENVMLWSPETKTPAEYLLEAFGRSRMGVPDAQGDVFVFQEGIGAMADWKSALLFLSRLKKAKEGYWLGAPQYELVDSFFRSVIGEREPTLVHRMLAQLSLPLRIRTIFTTNFDTLLEKAFAEARIELEVFGVHINSAIPPHSLTQKKRSLIKLHGSNYGLRADYSLACMPTHADVNAFVDSLCEEDPKEGIVQSLVERATDVRNTTRSPCNHLLVFGVSASDLRIVRLLGGALRQLDLDSFRVFWIAYTDKDVQEAQSLLRILREDSGIRPGQFTVIQHTFCGVFFLELYQYLTHSLPPAGLIFPSPLHLPFPAIPPKDVHLDSIQIEGKSEKRELAKEIIRISALKEHRFLLFLSKCNHTGKVSGVTTAAARAFETLSREAAQTVWIDLDDVGDADEAFEQILQAIAFKSGVSHWMPVVLNRFNRGWAKEVKKYTRLGERKWVLFLQAREGAGTKIDSLCCGDPADVAKLPNGWIDNLPDKAESQKIPRSTANAGALAAQFKELTGGECPNLTIVFLCWDTEQVRRHLAPLGEVAKLERNAPKVEISPQKVSKALDFDAWPKDKNDDSKSHREAVMRFLLALCRMRCSRYASVFWGWTFHGDRPEETANPRLRTSRYRADMWLTHLRNIGLVRGKPGGFIWMHSSIRSMLIRELPGRIRQVFGGGEFGSYTKSVGDQKYDCDAFLALDHDIQHGLAEWYENHSISSSDPMFAIESALHRCAGADTAQRIAAKVAPELAREYIHHATRALDSAARTLRDSRGRLLSSGSTRTACRKLLDIRKWCTANKASNAPDSPGDIRSKLYLSTVSLHRVSLELSRDMAQEISELQTMSQRSFELLALDGMEEVSSGAARDEAIREACGKSTPLGDGLLGARAIDFLRHEMAKCTAARSYDEAEVCFQRICRIVGFDSAKLDQRKIATLLHDTLGWSCSSLPIIGVETIMEFQKAVGSYMQLMLCRNQIHLICQIRELPAPSKGVDFLRRAVSCYWVFEELGRGLKGIDHNVRYRHVQVVKARLAVAWSGMRDFPEAHRRLDEAEACLKECDAGSTAMENGILALYRIEVLAQELLYVQATPSSSSPEHSQLGKWRRDLIALCSTGESPDEDDFKTRRLIYAEGGESSLYFQRCRAVLADAKQRLATASLDLASNRKNVLWVTWMTELGLKLIEIEMCMLCLEKLEQGVMPRRYSVRLPLNFDTPADRYLADAISMVRHDAFQLARVTESYMRIAAFFFLAVRSSGLMDKQVKSQLREFGATIQTAIETLETTTKKRRDIAASKALPSMDDDISGYIDYVTNTLPRLFKGALTL